MNSFLWRFIVPLCGLPLTTFADVHYVDLNCPTPTPPYTNWATAATNIQDAVDATASQDEVLVTNGVYAAGGKTYRGTLTNRVAITKAVSVRSVNGPEVTTIQGYQVPGTTNGNAAVRCVYLVYGATLSGFTLSGGATRTTASYLSDVNGGGVYSEAARLSNCIFLGNSAASSGGGVYYDGSIYGATATLDGCTLRSNSATNGGGAYAVTVVNSVFEANLAWSYGGGANRASITNSLFQNNVCYGYGGGAYSCTLSNCTLAGNLATGYGGGVSGGNVYGCTLSGNIASNSGGGACGGNLYDCTLTGNMAYTDGGGAEAATLQGCLIVSNSAPVIYGSGGGAHLGRLRNCAVLYNYGDNGGGVSRANCYNCTIVGNAADLGGGADSAGLTNCIVYYNSANWDPNSHYSTFDHCCTTPLPDTGAGNIDREPQLASASHISANSPCRGAGQAAMASGKDLDGEPWANPPSMGCDEFYPVGQGTVQEVHIDAAYTNVAVNFPVNFTGTIFGRVTSSRWDFGDGASVDNQPYTAHAWTGPGLYTVVLRAFSDTGSAGLAATTTVQVVSQPMHYVDAQSLAPDPPYNSWSTAAATIQDALDSATVPGALVLVRGGLYATGGRVVGGISNRVAVTLPLLLQSVDGPKATIIEGYQLPGVTNGDGAVRCVYLCSQSGLVGFTLTNGAAPSGAGAWCEAASVLLSNCVVTGNAAADDAGGIYGGRLVRCQIIGNTARYGGGVQNSDVRNSFLSGNSAVDGGGADGGTLVNCTVTGNSARWAGGVWASTANNCVIYYNSARYDQNYSYGTFNHCCMTPLPLSGPGNIDAEPGLASPSHLGASSPCAGAGDRALATGTDIDGEAWLSAPSMGCDEVHGAAAIGPIESTILRNYQSVATGFCVDFTARVEGKVTASRWDFGDGTVLSNRPFASHAWAASGDYLVTFRAYNQSNPGGIGASVAEQVVAQPIHYVALESTSPRPPYASWDTAATNIQDAVDSATVIGAMVLVSNGVYEAGGRVVYGALTNRLAVTRPVVVQSVNGPGATVIKGYQVPGATNGDAAIRCVCLSGGATLAGFTLTNGATRAVGDDEQERSGGGVWCAGQSALVSNCVLIGHAAAYRGGAAVYGNLSHCTIARSWAGFSGGGTAMAALSACTLTNNWGYNGGGAYGSALKRCTLMANASPFGGGAGWSKIADSILIGNNSTSDGGGVIDSSLLNCTLSNNWASVTGGGADSSMLVNCVLLNSWADKGGGVAGSAIENCTLAGNSARQGGGAYSSRLHNSVLYTNRATSSDPNYSFSTLNYCCAFPLPVSGVGNVTNDPAFVNLAVGDVRLQPNSPCINAGLNAYAMGTTDLDGNPRIVGGTVDIGAYEYPSPSSAIAYAWLQQYGLPTDGSADFIDSDSDSMNNWQEWIADTVPTDPASALRLLSASADLPAVTLTWQSSSNRSYFLERATDLTAQSSFTPIAPNIAGQFGSTSIRDTNAPLPGPALYRVGVQRP